MNQEEAIKIIDQLSGKDDRWLFLAVLIVLLAFCGLVIRYLVKQNESQRAAHAVQQDKHSVFAESMAVALHENTKIMNQLHEWLKAKAPIVLLLLVLPGCVSAAPRQTLGVGERWIDPPGAPFPLIVSTDTHTHE